METFKETFSTMFTHLTESLKPLIEQLSGFVTPILGGALILLFMYFFIMDIFN